ncbi:hypothetical protein TH25_17325 [Thalassospira profundimaris]|uniref:Uncharacterized protein n=1 Tax=Thalassospira profundimaris TaxID=502049 RepID=A0A367WX19_9PROT|nr:hypothetical protein [Thalassospira profundimaris]RCK45986.1 hypothetical protein TH25_17325 [Thalassospira profundimaris]
MSKLVRILVIVLLAAFAAGTVAHAASATSMTVKMSLADMNDGNVEDCPSCSGDQGTVPVCDQVCVPSLVAAPVGTALALPLFAYDFAAAPMGDSASLSGPPDPYPPRTNILI